MRFLTPKHHLDTAVPLRSAITALQITLQLRRPQLKSTRWMQPLHCKLQHKITKPIGTAQSTMSWLGLKMHFTMAGAKRTQNQHSRTRRTDEVPHIDAGSHFVRKKHRVSCDSETSPLRSSSNAICTHCLANHTTTAPTTSEINKMDAAIPMQTATQWTHRSR